MANRPALASNGRTILTSDHHHRPTEHSFPVSLYKNEACPPWTCLILVFTASKNRRDEIFKTSKRIENFVGSVFPNPSRAFLFSPPCLPEPSRTMQEYLFQKTFSTSAWHVRNMLACRLARHIQGEQITSRRSLVKLQSETGHQCYDTGNQRAHIVLIGHPFLIP